MTKKMNRLTKNSRLVLSIAHEEAESLKHSYIGTEHILMGLIYMKDGKAGRLLREFGLDPEQVKEMVKRLTGVGRHTGGQINLAPDTEQVLQLDFEEALRIGHHSIGTENLLIALIHQKGSVGFEVLQRLGVTPEHIKNKIQKIPSATSFSGHDRPQQATRLNELLLKTLSSEYREHSRALFALLKLVFRDVSVVLTALDEIQSHVESERPLEEIRNDIKPILLNLRALLKSIQDVLIDLAPSDPNL